MYSPDMTPDPVPAAVQTSRRQVLTAAGAAVAVAALGRLAAAQQATQPASRPRAVPPEMPRVGKAARPLNLLILGGTGFIGPFEVQHARARGHTVTIANRGRTRPEIFEGLDVEHLELDREQEPTALREAVAAGRKWDAVIDNSGYIPGQITAAAEAVKDAARQYLFVSTLSVFKQTGEGADEDAPKDEVPDEQVAGITTVREMMAVEGGRLYGPMKYRSELAAEAAMPGRATIVRPGLIVGPGDPTDRFTYWPARVMMEDRCGGKMLVPGSHEVPAEVQVIDVRDLAAFIVKLVEDNTTGRFNVVGPTERLTTVVEAAKQHAGTRTEFVSVPFDFLERENVAFWAELPMVVPPTGETAGFNRTVNGAALAAGLDPRPIEETTRATIDWWKTLPPQRRGLIESERSPAMKADREQALLEKWAAQQKQE